MRQLRRFIRFWFGLEALGLLGGTLNVCLSIAKGRIKASPLHLAVTIVGLLAFDLIPAVAWWRLKKGEPSGRIWAILASSVTVFASGLLLLRNLLHLPLIVIIGIVFGVAGLAAFWAKDSGSQVADTHAPRKVRLAGDGTSRMKDLAAQGASLGITWLAYHGWTQWAASRRLVAPGMFTYVGELLVAVVVTTIFHELGHAAAGWASGKILCSFQIGPFRWALRHGRWRFSFQGRKLLGGSVGMVAPDLVHMRSRNAFSILGGPVASLVIGSICTVATLTAVSHPWQPYWNLLSMMASIALADCIVNLIPLRPENGYSDGAQLLQIVTNGPWARVHLAFAMITSSAVSPVRPRDFDESLIRQAADFVPCGERGLLLRLYASSHYIDKDRIPEAIANLREAEALYEECKFERPQDVCAEFTFVNAFYKRDLAAAARWWQRIEASDGIDRDADYYRARTALLWLKGEQEQASEAWQRGNAIAQQLPSAGMYDFKRSCFVKLRQALDASLRTSSPSHAAPLEWPEIRVALEA